MLIVVYMMMLFYLLTQVFRLPKSSPLRTSIDNQTIRGNYINCTSVIIINNELKQQHNALTMHEFKQLVDNSFQETPMGPKKSRILSNYIHYVGCYYCFVVFSSFLFAQAQKLLHEINVHHNHCYIRSALTIKLTFHFTKARN